MSVTTQPPPSGVHSPGRRPAIRDVSTGLIFLLALAAATWWLLGLSASYLVVSVALYAGLGALLVLRAPTDLVGPGLGAANRVTLGRSVLAVPVVALAFGPAPLDTPGRWLVIVVATAVLILDGVDGRVARRTGTETAFGARFDMELDAALILALSVLVWTNAIAGAWVLLIGLMRYMFVAASWIWPALAAELPPNLRRKVVCVVQGVVLLVALGPIIPGTLATTVAAAGLAALTYSFGVDVRWLIRNGS